MADIIGVDLIKAINVLNADNTYGVTILGNDPDQISYRDADGNPIAAPFTKEEVLAEHTKLQAEHDALTWKRNRQAEYPSIEELVVALYDTDDKSAIEAKRAEVKAKYPKP